MTYDFLCDVFRVVNIVLAILLLAVLQRALHLRSSTWTHKTRGLHRFLTLLMIVTVLRLLEALRIDAPAQFTVFLQSAVLVYGIYAVWKSGSYERR